MWHAFIGFYWWQKENVWLVRQENVSYFTLRKVVFVTLLPFLLQVLLPTITVTLSNVKVLYFQTE